MIDDRLAIIISYPTSASVIIVPEIFALLRTIRRQWSLFLRHGVMAHIPWPLSQSKSWNNIIF